MLFLLATQVPNMPFLQGVNGDAYSPLPSLTTTSEIVGLVQGSNWSKLINSFKWTFICPGYIQVHTLAPDTICIYDVPANINTNIFQF